MANPPTLLARTNGGVWARKTSLLDATSNVASVTHTGGTGSADVTLESRIAIYVTNGAANNVVFDVQGSMDDTNFFDISYRVSSDVVYATLGTDVTVAGGTKQVIFISPSEYVRFVRINVGTANANGTTFDVYHSS